MMMPGSSGQFPWHRSKSPSSTSNRENAATDAASLDLKAKLEAAGIDVIYDDNRRACGRQVRDHGPDRIPVQLIVGPKGVKSGEVEIKVRKGGARETLPVEQGLARVIDLVKSQRVLA